MEIKKILPVVLGSILLLSCGASRQAVVANTELDAMMEERVFELKVKSVEPQVTTALMSIANSGLIQPGNTISSIDVGGEGYFIRLDDEKVSAHLPYYGERRMAGSYGNDTGIKFNEAPKNLRITKNEEKQSHEVTFSIADSSETYFFNINISATLKSTVSVGSSHRNRIRFTGLVSELKDEDYATTR